MPQTGTPLIQAPSSPDSSQPETATRPSPPRKIGRQRDGARHGYFAVASILTLLLLDLIALAIAFTAAERMRVIGGRFGAPSPTGDTWLFLASLATASIIGVFIVGGMYRQRRTISRVDEASRVVSRVSLGLVLALAAASLLRGEELIYSRRMLVYGWGFAIVAVTAGRLLHAAAIGRLRAHGVAADRLLIIGTGSTGRLVLDKVRRSPHLGYEVAGFAWHTLPEGTPPETVDGAPVLGSTRELAEIVERHTIDEIIVALSGTPHEEILELVYAVTNLPVSMKVYPDSFRLLTNDSLSVSDLNGLPTVSVRTIGLRRVDRVMKRAMDIVISATVLVLLSPLMLLLAVLVKLSSPGPVFFVQERVGQDGRVFQLLKFRSMPVDAEAATGPVWATPDDPRPTRIGRFMRRYSLDELPQFINVLLGEMSVVGPRPERPYFVEQFRQMIPAYMARHHEKSGVTGWAQVNGLRGDTSIEERTRYDLYYVENWSILFDLRIMARTLLHIFRRDNNAY